MNTAVNGANIAHILDELERINLLISINLSDFLEERSSKKIHETQAINTKTITNSDNFISTQEINNLDTPLNQPFGIPFWATKKLNHPVFKEEMVTLCNKIDVKIENSSKSENDLRLLKIKEFFNLSPKEFDIFLICLIGEFDTHYQDMWTNLQNASDKIYPSVEIILNLLSAKFVEKLKLRKYFHNESNLFKFNLLECVDVKYNSDVLNSHHTIKVSSRIVNYLLGDDTVAPILTNIVECISPTKIIEDLFLPTNLFNQIKSFVKYYETLAASKNLSIITLRGKKGVGRQMVAESICQTVGINILSVNIENILSNQSLELPLFLAIIRREAILQNAAIYWQNIHLLSANRTNSILSLFTKKLREFQGVHFFALGHYEYFPFYKIKSTLVQLTIPNLTVSERRAFWQNLISTLSLEDITKITNSFQLGRGQIYDIASHVQSLFKPDKDQLSQATIYQICHTHAHHNLSKFAKIIKPLYALENIILPHECKQELECMIDWIKYREIVYEKSGFDQKMTLGKGFMALFYGPPGTGKTMAVDVIATELQLPLYKIDLSQILSKYVGETEQHLEQVFSEAESSNAILFFDEADSLFGKRGEVKDARDNYANIQTSYLLQKVEEYPGIIILATNYKNNMDEAFIRRIHFSIDFPFPQSEQRYKIWQQIWPRDIQLDSNIDLQKIADKLNLTGSNIRSIALAAVFNATNIHKLEQLPIKISKNHLIIALKREFKKMGRIIINEQLDNLFI